MNNERETRGTNSAQGSGITSTTSPVNAGANMNPEAEGMQGWAGTAGYTNANRSIGDRLSSQYNNLSQTQKIVGASLLGAAAVGAAYLTRGMWGRKNSWTAQGQSSKKKSSQPMAASNSTEKQSRNGKANRSTSGEVTM